MFRSFGKLFSQFLLLIAPMLTLQWSFLNYMGHPGGATAPVTVNLFFLLPLTGEKQQVEMTLRIIASLVGFAFLIVYEISDTILPRRDLTEFRTVYLEQQQRIWRKQPDALPEDVRVNIMHVGHPWYTLFLGRFYWTWNDGFKPNHKDVNLRLLTFQGVSGMAYRANDPKEFDFRKIPSRTVRFANYKNYILDVVVLVFLSIVVWRFVRHPLSPYLSFVLLSGGLVLVAVHILRLDPFYLWPWQVRKTEDVKYILSIPLYRTSKGQSKAFKSVGVINLDTTSEAGAAFLKANKGRLVAYFDDIGKLIACLR